MENIRITDKYAYFWGSWASNWAPSTFVMEENGKTLTFHNSEQYFMYMKAKTFGDENIAMRILMEGEDPRTAKELGRLVKGYDDKVWNEKRYQVMVEANMLKFSQNKKLKKLLLSKKFEGKRFVEGSPYDKIWGIGCHWTKANDDKSNWNGLNLLGNCLDEVRSNLLEQEKINECKS